MALVSRTRSGMGIQTAHILVSYSASGLSVAVRSSSETGTKAEPHPFTVAAEQAEKSRWVKLNVRAFSKKNNRSPFFIPEYTHTHCSTAQIMSR